MLLNFFEIINPKIYRFKNFYAKLEKLGITKELKNNIETWSYNSLNEVNRISPLIKSKMKSNGII